MSFNVATGRFEDPRPTFIIHDPVTMTHPVAVPHHRIPWSLLRGVLNKVMSGEVEPRILEALLRLTPTRSTDILRGITDAIARVRSGTRLDADGASPSEVDTWRTGLQFLEQELFSLPANLFLGLAARDDAPGDMLDFTPADVDARAIAITVVQRLRETLYGLLRASPVPVDLVDETLSKIAAIWRISPGISVATGFTAAWWSPGVAPFTSPAFRHWASPTRTLTLTQVRILMAQVNARASRPGESPRFRPR